MRCCLEALDRLQIVVDDDLAPVWDWATFDGECVASCALTAFTTQPNALPPGHTTSSQNQRGQTVQLVVKVLVGTQPASRCAGELPEAVGLAALPRELRQLASLEVLSLSNCFRLPCLPPAVASLTPGQRAASPLCSG